MVAAIMQLCWSSRCRVCCSFTSAAHCAFASAVQSRVLLTALADHRHMSGALFSDHFWKATNTLLATAKCATILVRYRNP